MTVFSHVLASTDFSKPAYQAIERAATLASAHGGRLTLAHIIPATVLPALSDDIVGAIGPGWSEEALAGEALDRLARLARDVEARHGVACEPRIASGRAAASIAAMAEEGADLVVVAARGEHGARQSYIGATGQKVLRLSPCPVLLVRQPVQGNYRRILAPVDFSLSSRRALRAVATAFPSAELHVAHAFEHPHEGMMRYAAVEEHVIRRYSARRRAALERELPSWAREAAPDASLHAIHVRHGHPHTVIDRLMRRVHPDLVALAAHGKSEIEKTLLGSVSLHTALAARCDVLLLTGPHFRRGGAAAVRE